LKVPSRRRYNMPFKVTLSSSEIKFSACHFLLNHKECSRLHGHNYYVSVEIKGDLDENGFVVDFIELNRILKEIVKPLDHQMIIPRQSKEMDIQEKGDSVLVNVNHKKYMFPLSDVFFFPLSATTSELFSKYIHDKLRQVFPNKQIKVIIQESENSKAIYEE
jgi:6-pyruvoyltetrahydropterin/6-carboxytetrahydropterin synthase